MCIIGHFTFRSPHGKDSTFVKHCIITESSSL
jgi:hypothetical protein